MKRFEFSIRYETRAVVVKGKATVFGKYDGPSKPEALVRSALNGADGNLKVELLNCKPK